MATRYFQVDNSDSSDNLRTNDQDWTEAMNKDFQYIPSREHLADIDFFKAKYMIRSLNYQKVTIISENKILMSLSFR